MAAPDMRVYLEALVGQTLLTVTGKPNRIVGVESSRVIVGTDDNPGGAPISLGLLQGVVDRIHEGLEVVLDPRARSAFVAAVLQTMDDVEVLTNPRRGRLRLGTGTDDASRGPVARRSRKDQWMRDELILALDLYKSEGGNASKVSIEKLSALLRAMPIDEHLAADRKFRGPGSVSLKLYNFNALDPSTSNAGMTRGGRQDAEVWDEYSGDPVRLATAAEAIRANAPSLPREQAEIDEPDIADAPEGRVLTRIHRTRERNQKIIKRRKAQALAATGTLECEGCGFDFALVYGERGDGFIECHHTLPVSSLTPGARTRASDLALVCSNCHRMIHRRSPWLMMNQLRELLKPRSGAVASDAGGVHGSG